MFDLLLWMSLQITGAPTAIRMGDWRVTPRLASVARELRHEEVRVLLAEACRTPPEYIAHAVWRCTARLRGPAFADIVDDNLEAKGVVRGHFLSPESEDAIVSGSSAETHPARYGGTLLLTKRDGKWAPVAYKSAVITRSCEKIRHLTGREILLCEDEHAGMGFHSHFLYTVDPRAMGGLGEQQILRTQSFGSPCMKRQQTVASVRYEQKTRLLAVTVLTPRWDRSHGLCASDPGPAKRPPRVQVKKFRLGDGGFTEWPR